MEKENRLSEITEELRHEGSIDRHRINLSELYITWLQTHGDAGTKKKHEINNTFYQLNQILEEIGKMGN
jgi:hypothetical protein